MSKKKDSFVGKACINKQSKKAYKITSWTETHVQIKRDTDGHTFKLSRIAFKTNYTLKKDDDENNLYHLVVPDERHRFENMVLYPECVHGIRVGMNRILQRDNLVRVWNIDKLEPKAKTILGFYGPPGTGKTMAAICLAREFNKPLMQVDYSKVVNCLHGETGKQLSAAFAAAKEANAIFFFDEADSLVSKRINMHADRMSIASAINQERNIFMQELDRFEGVVILTTNFFKNYDDAILRRVAQHVHFKLPNQEMRERLFKSHVPNTDRVRNISWTDIAVSSKGLSGGDIFQVVINAINAASLDPDPNNWYLTQEHIMDEVQRTLEAKKAHEAKPRGLLSLLKDAEKAQEEKAQEAPTVGPITPVATDPTPVLPSVPVEPSSKVA